jgi:hypothetical protein
MFQEELSNKVSEIRRLALDEYDRWLRQNPAEVTTERGTGFHPLSLNEARTAIEVPPMLAPRDVAYYTNSFQAFLSDLDRLEERFQRYFDLAAGSLDDLRDLLAPLQETVLSDLFGQGRQLGAVPDPGSVTGRITHATNSVVLPMADPDVDEVDVYTSGIWGGAAARSFNENFLVPFSAYCGRQAFCAVYLADVVQMVRNTAKDTQDDLLAIADACIAALKGEVNVNMGAALSAGSLLTSVVGLFVPPPWDRVLGFASLALDVGSRFQHLDDPPEWEINSASLWHYDAIYPAHEHLTTLEQRLAELDDTLGGAISEDAANTFYSPTFRLKSDRPDPPDAIVPSVEAPSQPPDDMFVADIQAVYLYGRVTFPEAADEYGAAADKLDRCELPQWVNVILPRSCVEFAMSRACLTPALQTTQENLSYAGATLVTICNEYEWQDAANAAAFQQFAEELEAPRPPIYEYPTSVTEEKMSHS